jgi:hypothetical protein
LLPAYEQQAKFAHRLRSVRMSNFLFCSPLTMEKKKRNEEPVIVEKEKFDAALASLLKAKPVPMKKIKTTGKRPKGPLFPSGS